MTLKDVVSMIRDPETLLRRCSLMIGGGAGPAPANGQAAVCTFRADVQADTRKGYTTGLSGFFGIRKDRPRVRISKITKTGEPSKGTLDAGEFNAYYIPMVSVDDANNGSSRYTLPTDGYVDIAITSQITGCVFSLGSDANGAILASHIQPTKGSPTS